MRLVPRPTLPAIAIAAAWTGLAAAQDGPRPWRPTVHVQGEVRLDDNLFLLTPGRRSRLPDPTSADLQSSRFRDMEEGADLIPIATLALGIDGPGLGGRPLDVEGDVAYEANLRNAARRHAEIDLRIAQALRRGGRLRLTADLRPGYFHKNYLADATDADADGDIAPEERRYAPGHSDEIDLALSYRRRLARGVSGEVTASYFDRRYDAPFAGRGRSGPGAGAAVTAEAGRRWVVGVAYAFASLGGDPASEVVLLDETAFGQDFNGNANTSDTSARAVVPVDRSRVEHDLRLVARTDLSRRAALELTYGYRIRVFGSNEAYDIVNRDRRDRRHDLGADVEVRLRSGIRLLLGARRTSQTTNRAGDPGSTGDEADYTRHTLFAGLRYRL